MKEYEISNEIALKNAIFSLNTEGYTVNEDCIANCKKLLNNEELDKVVGGEERRTDRDPSRQRFIAGGGGSPAQYVTPPEPLTPEQIQALLNAANENPHHIGPVKK